MKKVLKQIIACAIAMSMLLTGQMIVFAQKTFSDLPSSHWAYSTINTLVNDGTINGYEDGTFKPEGTVTRAEFVKMIGAGPTVRAERYYDIDETHWAYNYIMTSGMKEDGSNRFFPDRAITRGEVVELLWKRGGSVKGTVAPSAVTEQYKDNTDAVAWAYTYGLMQGDNGVDLRTSDTLTRAEATALIVRARGITVNSPKSDIVNTVSEELLKTVFESIYIFEDREYNANKTITNGEFAKAAVRLATGERILTYKGYSAIAEFEHKYAKDIYAMGVACLGEDTINLAFANKKTTVQDGLAMLVHAAIRNSAYPVGYGAKNNYYADVTGTLTDNENKFLTYAYQNGIKLYASDKIDATREITHKDIACILLQLDKKIGLIKLKTTDENSIYRAGKIRTDLASYPANASEYRYILDSVPNIVYSTELTAYGDVNSNRDAVYALASEYKYIFETTLKGYRYLCQKNGADVRFTYYPSLVYDNGNGYTMRVKCEVTGEPMNVYMQDMFKGEYGDNYKVYKGMTFYMDIVTGGPITDIVVDTDKVEVDKMVAIVINITKKTSRGKSFLYFLCRGRRPRRPDLTNKTKIQYYYYT